MIDNAEVLQDVLDAVVLERHDDQWRSQYPFPEWFSKTLIARPRDGGVTSFRTGDSSSEFFRHLLEDAAGFRPPDDDPDRRLSEVWAEDSSGPEAMFFAARVQRWRGRLILIVSRLGDEFARRRARLQTAREELLTSERLEAEVFRRTQSIRSREEEIALRLLAASRAHDTETGSHVKRIGLYSAALAKVLGWPAQAVADIRVAAPMHDIGKIGIPDRILKKPGRLDTQEWEIMKTHTAIGAELLASDDVPLLQMAAEIAIGHHEHFDGSGYPHGLEGEAIPVAARIVSIVDVYDALVHKRVYKPSFPEDEVIAHMQGLSGSQFDPALLALFFENLPVMRRIRDDNPDEPADGAVQASLDEIARDALALTVESVR